MGTAIQLYADANPGDAMASIDCPADGLLVGCDWAIAVAASGADFSVRAELSFLSTSQFVSNDARGGISSISMAADLTTSGAMRTSENKYVRLPDIPVSMGERIYIHGAGTAISLNVKCRLHFDFNLDRPRSRLR